MPRRTWTDDQLREAAASARCLADVMRALGIKQQRTIVRRAAEIGLKLPSGKSTTWTDDEIRSAVANATTIHGALKALRIEGRGNNYRTFHKHVTRLGLDTSHFVGKSHLAGQARENLTSRRPLSAILVENSTYDNTKRLGERLVREGLLEARCSECGLTEWRGRPIPLDLDHINGIRTDLRPENLRFLCPNCHAFTPTYRGKNASKKRRRLTT